MEKDFRYGSVLKLTRYDDDKSIEQNFSLMKDCGMNTVVVWPAAFWWEEKNEYYPFNTGRKVLKIAEKYNIKVIMELAGQLTVFESIPDFLMKEEYYPVDYNSNRDLFQAEYGFLNYFHPEVEHFICENFKKAALAYKDFPSLLGYDIFNETMFRSYDMYTLAEYRKWLREKYGTIENLNQVWERTYTDWEQVGFEVWKWMSIMPAADNAAFFKAAIGKFLERWCNAIYEVDREHMLIADNCDSMIAPIHNYERSQEDFEIKEIVGEVGISFYPKSMEGIKESALRWEIFDGFYASSKREGFYISEMQTHIQAMFNNVTCVRPYELNQWCMEGYAAGAKGLIFWMFRPFNKGIQTMGRGLVDYKGRPTLRYDEAKKMSNIFKKYGVLNPIKSRVAILYDSLCDDFQRCYTRSYSTDNVIYLNSVYGAYKALYDCGVRADICRIDEIEKYDVIFVSNNIVINKSRADAFKKYAKNGGTIIIDGKFGVVDDESLLCKDLPGGEINQVLGIDLIDVDYDGLEFEYNGFKVNGYYQRDIVQASDTEIAGKFSDGNAAVTKTKYGKGCILTFNTFLWYGYQKTNDNSIKLLAESIIDEFGLRQIHISGNVSARISQTDDKFIVFIFNYQDNEQSVKITFGDKEEKYNINDVVKAHETKVVEIDKQ